MVETSVMVGVIVALGELIKSLNIIDVKYIPLIDLLLGVIMSIIYGTGNIKTDIFNGVVVGLSACGLYSSVKNVKQGINK